MEFDKAATRQVQRIFTQIDELLYERKASCFVDGLQEECQEWTSHFPHLRYIKFHSAQSYAVELYLEDGQLGIFGTKLKSPYKNDLRTPVYSSEEHQEDDDTGIILSEGVMEDYLAFDCRDKNMSLDRHWEEAVTGELNCAIKTTRVENINPYAPSHHPPLVLPPVHAKIPVFVFIGYCNFDVLCHLMSYRDSDDKSPLRPTSAALMSGKPRPVRSLEHSSSSLSRNVSSARRRNPPRTLHPINNSSSRVGTPKMDDVIRGTRLHATNDQLSCSPVPFTRNNLLPPIVTSDADHQSIPGSQRQTVNIKHSTSLLNPLRTPDVTCTSCPQVSLRPADVQERLIPLLPDTHLPRWIPRRSGREEACPCDLHGQARLMSPRCVVTSSAGVPMQSNGGEAPSEPSISPTIAAREMLFYTAEKGRVSPFQRYIALTVLPPDHVSAPIGAKTQFEPGGGLTSWMPAKPPGPPPPTDNLTICVRMSVGQ
uniref:DUF3719 domain-containing protein n=1 Tax=Leptobrachium leishanense TaxID=445787 RepID=A0A8C5QES5_9ANUR